MRRLKGKIIKLSFDFMLSAASVWCAFWVYTHGEMPGLDLLVEQALAFAGVFVVFSAFMGTHRTIWRYTSVADLMTLVGTAVLTLFAFGLFQHFFRHEYVFAPSFIVVQGLVLVALLAGQRLFYRVINEGLFVSRRKDDGCDRVKVLLVGAGPAADRFIKAVRANPQGGYDIVGVVDNRRTLFGDRLHGVPILGKGKHLDRILRTLAEEGKSPTRLVFTETHDDTATVDLKDVPESVLARPEDYGLKLARLSGGDMFSEGLDLSPGGQGRMALRAVAIEDLLGRPQATLDTESIRTLIAGRRVAVTGAGGSIGSELCRQIARLDPAAMTMLDFSEYNLYSLEQDMLDLKTAFPWRAQMCNVRVAEQVRKVFATFRPDIVFHAAALKHVPLVEANPCEGVLTNVSGTRVVAEACLEFKAGTMVQISTDKAVNPCNVMGATKRLGEFLAQSLDLEGAGTRFVTVRFGNVLGSSGSVVPMFRKQLERGGPLTVTHPDICRFFMTIGEAVSLVLQASAQALRHPDERGRILVLDMGDPVKIADVARRMIRLAGLRPDEDVKIEYIGLRPGEKMYEELFDYNEERTATDSPQILAAISQVPDGALLRRAAANLEETARRGDDEAVVRMLRSIVPGYTGDPAAGHPRERAAGA